MDVSALTFYLKLRWALWFLNIRMRRVNLNVHIVLRITFIDFKFAFIFIHCLIIFAVLRSFLCSLPFHSSILEPNFHLCLRQAETGGHLVPLRPGEVLALLELLLQLEQLLGGEGCPWSSGLSKKRVGVPCEVRKVLVEHARPGKNL